MTEHNKHLALAPHVVARVKKKPTVTLSTAPDQGSGRSKLQTIHAGSIEEGGSMVTKLHTKIALRPRAPVFLSKANRAMAFRASGFTSRWACNTHPITPWPFWTPDWKSQSPNYGSNPTERLIIQQWTKPSKKVTNQTIKIKLTCQSMDQTKQMG